MGMLSYSTGGIQLSTIKFFKDGKKPGNNVDLLLGRRYTSGGLPQVKGGRSLPVQEVIRYLGCGGRNRVDNNHLHFNPLSRPSVCDRLCLSLTNFAQLKNP